MSIRRDTRTWTCGANVFHGRFWEGRLGFLKAAPDRFFAEHPYILAIIDYKQQRSYLYLQVTHSLDHLQCRRRERWLRLASEAIAIGTSQQGRSHSLSCLDSGSSVPIPPPLTQVDEKRTTPVCE